jgi:hypothetical protein
LSCGAEDADERAIDCGCTRSESLELLKDAAYVARRDRPHDVE